MIYIIANTVQYEQLCQVTNQTQVDLFNNGDLQQLISQQGTLQIPCGVTDIKGQVTSSQYADNIKEIIIPDSVLTFSGYKQLGILYKGSFQDCNNLVTVQIPQSIQRIENNTFQGCTKLQNITLPQTLKEIGISAFQGCTSLSYIYLPNNIELIESSAFYSCEALTNIVIPPKITIINSSVFMNCNSLQTVSIQGNVTQISSSAFYQCGKLTTINFPETLTIISEQAFMNCSSLVSINIPQSVQNITSYAFAGTDNLQCVSIQNENCNVSSMAFYGSSVSYYKLKYGQEDTCPIFQYVSCTNTKNDYIIYVHYEKYCLDQSTVQFYIVDDQQNKVYEMQCPSDKNLYVYDNNNPQECLDKCPDKYEQQVMLCVRKYVNPWIYVGVTLVIVIVIIVIISIIICCCKKGKDNNQRSKKITSMNEQHESA